MNLPIESANIEEVHVLNNGVTLIVKKIFLDPKNKFVVVDYPTFSNNICYWLSNPIKSVKKVINSIEIVTAEEKIERNPGSFVEILENNIGRRVIITKKRYEGGAQFAEDIEGVVKEIVSKKFAQLQLPSKKLAIVSLNNLDCVETVEESPLKLVTESPTKVQKMKINYFTKEKTFVYLTYINRSLSISANYRLFLDETKRAGNMKLEVLMYNNYIDLAPKLFHFHFGTPKFSESFSLINHANSFVLNGLSHNSYGLLKSTDKKKSICYKVENVESKSQSKMIIPIFENDIKFDKVYKCILYQSPDSLTTKKIVRIKNESKFEWTNAQCITSSSKKLFGGNTLIPHVKLNEIAEIELKVTQSVKIFYSEDIEKICQIKQKKNTIIGEVIVVGKVKITNLKDKDVIVIIKHSFPGKFTSSSIKANSVEEKIVANDLNPKETTMTFVLKIAKNSKKKKLTIKYTKWDRQDSLGKKAENFQLDNFFKKKQGMKSNMNEMKQSMPKKKKRKLKKPMKKAMQKQDKYGSDSDDDEEEEDYDESYSSAEEFNEEECYQELLF